MPSSPLASPADADTAAAGATTTPAPPARALAAPSLRVTRVATGFEYPWDVQPIARGTYLVTTRETRRLFRIKDGRKTRVRFPSSSVWASGETGLMSLEIDPGFSSNRRFYTCQGGFRSGGGHDVRVVAWRLNAAGTRATWQRTLLSGIQATSGRHGGCRLLITRSGALLVGTGDAAVGTNPRNLRSLNGKVLRMNRMTGAPWPANPRIGSPYRKTRYVLTWGHRNVQGLAQRADGSLWSVEHGTYRDDEVNRLVADGDYGYNPVPGYNEDVPMTDHSLPGTAALGPVAQRQPDHRHLRRRLGQGQRVGQLQRHARGRRAQGQPRRLHEVRLQRDAPVDPRPRRCCATTAGSGRSPAPPTATC